MTELIARSVQLTAEDSSVSFIEGHRHSLRAARIQLDLKADCIKQLCTVLLSKCKDLALFGQAVTDKLLDSMHVSALQPHD